MKQRKPISRLPKKPKTLESRQVKRKWQQDEVVAVAPKPAIFDAEPKSYITMDEVGQFVIPEAEPTELQKWYLERICRGTKVCAECGNPLNYKNSNIAYGSQAHVLPKKEFPSIKTHPFNGIELGRYCCHGQYDSSWENASKMKVWPMVKQIMFKFLIPELPAREYRKLPDIIRDEYEQTISL